MEQVPSIRKVLWALAACSVAVVVCYFAIDRPVAYYVHDHRLNQNEVLRWLTLPPPVLQTWAPAVLVACLIRRAWKPLQRWELTLLAAFVGLILADQFKESLAVVFGRAWPETWINHNPSLIGDGTFGFHFFQGKVEFASFPSGHMARVGAAAAVFWIVYPGWRWACAVAMGATAAGLLGMNYHFVGDVVAGSVIGAIIGTYTAYGFGLSHPSDHSFQQAPQG